jgi:hypothetical protein
MSSIQLIDLPRGLVWQLTIVKLFVFEEVEHLAYVRMTSIPDGVRSKSGMPPAVTFRGRAHAVRRLRRREIRLGVI